MSPVTATLSARVLCVSLYCSLRKQLHGLWQSAALQFRPEHIREQLLAALARCSSFHLRAIA